MGEYVWTEYRIGGTLTRDKFEELKEFADSFSDCYTTHVDNERLYVAGELNYGNFDEFDDFLQGNNLTFRASWAAAPGCFDSGLRYWKPGMEWVEEEAANDDGEPTMSLLYLERAQRNGKTLEQVIAEMRLASSGSVPPLEIVEAATEDRVNEKMRQLSEAIGTLASQAWPHTAEKNPR